MFDCLHSGLILGCLVVVLDSWMVLVWCCLMLLPLICGCYLDAWRLLLWITWFTCLVVSFVVCFTCWCFALCVWSVEFVCSSVFGGCLVV